MGELFSTAYPLQQRRLVAVIGAINAMLLVDPSNVKLTLIRALAREEYDKLYQRGITGF